MIVLGAWCLIVVVVSTLAYYPLSVYGQGATTKYYGGPITKVTYCTCYYNPGVMLEIKDKSNKNQPLKIFYSPFKSLLRAYYNVWHVGPQVLGAYTPRPYGCEMTTSWGCSLYDVASGVIDSIKGIGTTAH